MAVTGDGRRRTPVDEDQGCYRTSSGNRERRFGRGCVQTSATVDGGQSFPPTPLFSGPSDKECRSRRYSAHQRSRSPPFVHKYRHHPPLSSSSSEFHYHHICNQYHDHDQILHPTPHIHHYRYPHHQDQHSNPISDSPHTYTTNYIPINPLNSFIYNNQRPKNISNPSTIHLYHHQPSSPSFTQKK
ncbi:hypothetical protein Dsin_032391 [Dipteronia sinensis]|uniref:Uncharacterized protein n=1 Tax=Dipteronia sinensis TaxID=43782 RepID=A0AAE0DUA0_9ROSI|nr:hypothetical protein Dsin_032391 [Dipteronia sinensis]